MRSKILYKIYIIFIIQFFVLVTRGQDCEIELAYDVQNVSCYKGNDGAIDLHVNGIENPVIHWDCGPQTEDVFELEAGTYKVTVSDSTCSVQNSIEVKAPQNPLKLQLIDKKDITCLGQENGEMTVAASGGLPPYEYSINNGESFFPDQQFEHLSDGEYIVSVRDFNQCIAGANIKILPATELPADIGNEIQVYSGERIDIVAPEGYWEYHWSTGESTRIITFIGEVEKNTTEYISVDMIDENGCSTISNSLKVNIVVLENSETD